MGGAPQLLIVDDEEALAESLARAARARGYDVETAREGKEAWSRLCLRRFDVVVTDLRMPGLDGPELMGRIRAERLPARVVVITGFATLDAAVDCLRKGAVDFLVKPFEVETFLKSVEKAVARTESILAGEPDWEWVAGKYGLTSRQKEVIRAIYATGKTAREVAEELNVSYDTVKSHLKAAYHKMGVSTRTQLLQKLRLRE